MSKVGVSRLKSLTGHNDSVYCLERSQYDSGFFSAAGDGMVVYWDLKDPENGQLIAKLPNSIYGLHYSDLTNTLIVGHNYDGIHLLDWENKKELGSLKFTEEAIFSIQSFGDFLYIGDASGLITVVEMKSLTIVDKLRHSQKSVRSIAMNPTAPEIAVGYSDHKIRVFDREDRSLKYELEGHANSVFTTVFSPDGQLLLSAGRDAHIKIWDTKAGYLLLDDIVAHMYAINHLDFSPDGKHFVTCSMDKSIKVWDAQTFRLLKVIDKARHAGHGTSVNKLLWSEHENTLISASDDRTISVWNIEFNN